MESSNGPPAPERPDSAPKRNGWRKVRYILYSLLALLGAWLALMVIMTAAAAWYTSRPQFCNSCHIMEPYYKSWQESSHKNVTCVECHFPPGLGGEVRSKLLGLVQVIKYVTASAGPKPTAEIPDASCLRSGCHQTRLLSGRVDFHGLDFHGKEWHIPFDHTPHLQAGRRGMDLRCTSCHSQIVQGSHMTVTPTTCFLCHFKNEPFNAGLSACTRCHQIPAQEFNLGGGVKFTHELVIKRGVDCANCHRDLIRGNGDVPRQRCISCHSREGDLAKYGDFGFMHQKHVTDHKIDCTQCHSVIEHNLEPNKIEQAVDDCRSCHPDHHRQQVDLLRGVGAKTVAVEPNLMLGVRAECRTCHRVSSTDARGDVLVRGSLQMCSMCHDAATVRKFETAHVALRTDLPLLEKALSDVQAAAKKGGLSAERAEKIAGETAALRHDLDLLRTGNDIHNMPFSANIERKAVERLTGLCKELKIAEPKVSLPPLETRLDKP